MIQKYIFTHKYLKYIQNLLSLRQILEIHRLHIPSLLKSIILLLFDNHCQ